VGPTGATDQSARDAPAKVMTTRPLLAGQSLLVIGGSSGIGLETARQGREEGATVIITARDPERVHRAGIDLGASIAAFDATDFQRLERFFDELSTPVDHLLVSGPAPHDGPLVSLSVESARADLDAHLVLPLQVARVAPTVIRPAGTLIFIGCIDGGHAVAGRTLISGMTAALSMITKGLAFELAPIRVNLIAAGFVDTPLAANALGDQLDSRREELTKKLPIRRVIGPTDVAALALHLMTNTAVTGATFDIDGGQQLVRVGQ
jgi:NAD(P)-dependent dehydrogenase (short-subunit alcohol dehydrogenase family)